MANLNRKIENDFVQFQLITFPFHEKVKTDESSAVENIMQVQTDAANSQPKMISTDETIENVLSDKHNANLIEETTLNHLHSGTETGDPVTILNKPVSKNQRVVDTVVGAKTPITFNTINDIQSNLQSITEYADVSLLPLVKACAPLTKLIPNLSFYVELALNETAEQPPDGLTIDESAAVRLYTIEWENGQRSLYSMLNSTLKKDSRENLRPYFKYLKLFLTALVKLPFVRPLTVWRGVTKDLSADFPPGTSVIWWAFSSCTTSLPVLESNLYLGNTGKRTLFSVEAINGRSIQAHSNFTSEDEVLLLPGTQMIVQSQFSPGSDLHIIHLKQIIPKQVLLKPPFQGARLYPKTERSWYRKKRFIIPICLLITLLIGASIIGSVLGKKLNSDSTVNKCMNPYTDSTVSTIGESSTALMSGYFNNDSQRDLAILSKRVLSNNGQTIINVDIILGNENGTFPTALVFETSTSPYYGIAADFNNDGVQDIAVLMQADQILSVLLGTGDGSFQGQTQYLVGNVPTSLLSGYFNNDTALDIVVTNSRDNTISVLLGNNDGTLQNQIVQQVGELPCSVVSGDFNNDGRLDIAVVTQTDNTTAILLGNGNGTFQELVKYSIYHFPNSAVSGDFNTDGHVDIAVANSVSSTITVIFGDGNGTFPIQTEFQAGDNPNGIVSADLNNDKQLDLIVANTFNNISVLFSDGNGNFSTPQTYDVRQSENTFTFLNSVQAADFNNDNISDLAFVSVYSNSIGVLIRGADGSVQPVVLYAAGEYPTSIIVSDLNNDGNRDIVVLNQYDSIILSMLGNGDGTFHGRLPFLLWNTPNGMAIGDFDNDTRSDLALTNPDSTITMLLNYSYGTFHTVWILQVAEIAGAVISEDFNADGKMDLMLANTKNGSVSILLGYGNGTFEDPSTFLTGKQPISLTAGDFNNDMIMDLAVANYQDRNISVLLGYGNGSFHSQLTYASGLNPISLISTDLNNDGILDLVVANQGENTVSTLLGNEDGTFQSQVKHNVHTGPTIVVSADFNLDQKIDIATLVQHSNNIDLLFNNGNMIFAPPMSLATGLGPSALIVEDFNHNNKPDLAVVNTQSNSLMIFSDECP